MLLNIYVRGAESQQSGWKEDSKGCLEAAVAEQNTFSLYMYPVWLGAATALDLTLSSMGATHYKWLLST